MGGLLSMKLKPKRLECMQEESNILRLQLNGKQCFFFFTWIITERKGIDWLIRNHARMWLKKR
jgi:hypothetical protein